MPSGYYRRRNRSWTRPPVRAQRGGMNFAKQKVVVLGGTSGIGYATAEAAIQRGAEVVVVSRDERRVRDAAERLGATGLAADLSAPSLAAPGLAADLAAPTLAADLAAPTLAADLGGPVNGLFERIGAFDHLVYTAGEQLAL